MTKIVNDFTNLVSPKKRKEPKLRSTLSVGRKERKTKANATISLMETQANSSYDKDGNVNQCLSINTMYYPIGNNPHRLCQYKDNELRKSGHKCYGLVMIDCKMNRIYVAPQHDNPGGESNYVRKFRRNKKQGRGYFFFHLHENDDFKFEFTSLLKQRIKCMMEEVQDIIVGGTSYGPGFYIDVPAHIKLSMKG